MPKFPNLAKRFRVRYEPNRKGKQYVVVFTKIWYDAKDPSKASPELRKKTSFATFTEKRTNVYNRPLQSTALLPM